MYRENKKIFIYLSKYKAGRRKILIAYSLHLTLLYCQAT
jgi:hypothetical protein